MTDLDRLLELEQKFAGYGVMCQVPPREELAEYNSLKAKIEGKCEKYDKVFHGQNQVNKALDSMVDECIELEQQNSKLESQNKELRDWLLKILDIYNKDSLDDETVGRIILAIQGSNRMREHYQKENKELKEQLKIKKDDNGFLNAVITNLKDEIKELKEDNIGKTEKLTYWAEKSDKLEQKLEKIKEEIKLNAIRQDHKTIFNIKAILDEESK